MDMEQVKNNLLILGSVTQSGLLPIFFFDIPSYSGRGKNV